MDPNSTLIAKWIQFLKNNRIVSQKSDPTTGKLKYNRKPTTDDLTKFLKNFTRYSDEQISDALQTVSVIKVREPSAQNIDVPSTQDNAPQPDPSQTNADTKKSDLTNKELSDNPESIKRREQRERANQKKKSSIDSFNQMTKALSEELSVPTRELSEYDIERIFKILSSNQISDPLDDTDDKVEELPAEEKKRTELNKIKRVIRDKMTDAQQKALWRLLHNA